MTAAQVSSQDVSMARISNAQASTAVGASSHMIRASSPLSW